MKAGEWSQIQPPLSETTLKTLSRLNFTQMTPVQAVTLPLFLGYKDVAVQAPTGSGKTLSFVVPIIEKLLGFRKEAKFGLHEIKAIVVTPTRELAQQIFQVLTPFLEDLDNTFSAMQLIGGTDVEGDVAKFEKNGAHIIIATPGRLNHMFDQTQNFNVRQLEMLVFDEADRLLDMGFHVAIQSILEKLPKQRRTGLFSATQTQQVEELMKAGLRNPKKVTVNVESKGNQDVQNVPSTLTNYYTICEEHEKLNLLVDFLIEHAHEKIIIFFLTCACVNYFWKVLKDLAQLKDTTFLSIHGKIPTNKRSAIVEKFEALSSGVLFTTDLAARGLDFTRYPVHWVVQYDPPQDPAYFVHRVGRTARMGATGQALLFLYPAEVTYLDFLGVRRIPISEYTRKNAKPPTDVILAIKKMIRSDREILDKSQLAFLSYVRAYKEHHCSFIFIFSNLNVVNLLNGFCILKVPKMPELPSSATEGFVEEDTESIAYKDKIRERQRHEKAAKKEEKEKKRAQKQEERERKKQRAQQARQKQRHTAEEEDSDDIEEFRREAALMKRLKGKKITQKQFDVLCKDSFDTSEDDESSSEESKASESQVSKETNNPNIAKDNRSTTNVTTTKKFPNAKKRKQRKSQPKPPVKRQRK